ncbi:MAG: 16S rRNA (cytosine(1402)-N(4))-methyltransferase RsmH [Negativicutes bacterium]|jgi:16S rRNA (cytosine1402-N4)-methyltransferase
MEFKHTSVLLDESIEGLNIRAEGIYLDCTLGGAGHAAAIASRLTTGTLIAFDQDEAALAAARIRLKDVGCNVELIKTNFENLNEALDSAGITALDGVLYDLGVSSYQLDTPERGFSYMNDGPLDMRMDDGADLTAEVIVNTYPEREICKIIREYGEDNWAARIAQFIVNARKTNHIVTTGQLTAIIKAAIPAAARRDGPHPAKRTFQALRIAVNRELEILEHSFSAAVERLKPGGRICIITFHSLEDRIAKQFFVRLAKGCVCPPRMPICVCGKKPSLKIIGNIIPGTNELEVNPRARSARLRMAEKI